MNAGVRPFDLAPPAARPRVGGFRMRLLVAMMLIVSAITGTGLYFADRDLTAKTGEDLQREFQGKLAALQNAQDIRYAVLVDRCRALARRQRIRAALEDGALELLYPSAGDELRLIMQRSEAPGTDRGLQVEFCRFVDARGAIIPGGNRHQFGELTPAEETQLSLPGAPAKLQIGYLRRPAGAAGETIFEMIAVPIVASDNGEVIAALVLGFKPFELGAGRVSGSRNGVWLAGHLDGTGLEPTVANALAQKVGAAIAAPVAAQAPATSEAQGSLRVVLDGAPHQVFYKHLNPDSDFPPAYEVCIYPLTELHARQRRLRWQVLGTGALLLLGGWMVSHYTAARLSAPVEKLAVDSEEQRVQRARAEAELEVRSEELQRSARFSADASHQLKTPVTVLRAGLEELLARENLSPEECDQLSALIHQTFRLSSLIEDLLLLSRMDAGRLKLELAPVDLSQLIEAALDDLGALPDELELRVTTDFPTALHVAGEKRYTTIILQNLLENARKYNRRGGEIRLGARAAGTDVFLTVGNTGRPISAAAQAHIFERFHRGAIGENVPGYGLGLNLARELARLHGGDLKLARSDENGTEFEVRFRNATAPRTPGVSA